MAPLHHGDVGRQAQSTETAFSRGALLPEAMQDSRLLCAVRFCFYPRL